MARPPKDELNPREMAFIANYTGDNSPVRGKAYQSALRAGYSTSMAQAARKRIMPKIYKTIREEMDKQIPLRRIITRLSEGLDAMGTRFFLSRSGEMIETPARPLIAERRQYAELICRLRGDLINRVEMDTNVTHTLAERLQRALESRNTNDSDRNTIDVTPQDVVVDPLSSK